MACILFGFVDVGMIEETQRKLDAQYAANAFVNIRHRHLAGLHQFHHVIVIKAAGHVHVDAGEEGFAGGSRAVVRDSVGHDFGDRGPVAVDDAAESPLFAEDLGKRKWVGRRRHPVEGIERAHDGCRNRRSPPRGRAEDKFHAIVCSEISVLL